MDKQLNFQVLRSQEFNSWFEEQTKPTQGLILARLHRISVEGHFGTTNYFDDLIELKWVSGLRVYTARIGQIVIVVLGGGNKNGQSKDIKKAKKIRSEMEKKIGSEMEKKRGAAKHPPPNPRFASPNPKSSHRNPTQKQNPNRNHHKISTR